MTADPKKTNKIATIFCVRILYFIKSPCRLTSFFSVDGRLVSCFGKSKPEVSSVTLQCFEISAQARDCTILKII